jgi:CheY-like chemotaxis protein
LARKILLADDSVTAQNMGRKILTDAGYEVVTVNNGSAALKKIFEVKPDLIVLDVYMPGYSGLEVCQRIKENKDSSRIPVLLTVGKLEPFKPEEARRVRADAFVVKPFEASELLAALARLEDKIVPQPEPYKQGRFAKAVAAVDDQVAVDKDETWKARLRIPTGEPKPESVPEREIPVPTKAFRDFHSENSGKHEPKREGVFEHSVPAGVPADITPEEIAAITAAAAQLRGGGASLRTADAEPATSPAVIVPASSEAAHNESSPVTFASAPEAPAPSVGLSLAATGERSSVSEHHSEPHSQPAIATGASETPALAETAPVAESQTSQGPETPQVTTPAEDTSTPVTSVAVPAESETTVTAVTVSDSAPSTNDATAAAEVSTPPAPPPADDEVMAALQSLMPANLAVEPMPAHASASDLAPSALAALAGDSAVLKAHAPGPRWIAEEVALADDEGTISLQREMEHAYAAVAASGAVLAASAAVAEEPSTPTAAGNPVENSAIASHAQDQPTESAAVYAMAAGAAESATIASPAHERLSHADITSSQAQATAESSIPLSHASSLTNGIAPVTLPSETQDSTEAHISEGVEDMAASWKNIRDSIATGGAVKAAPGKEKEEIAPVDTAHADLGAASAPEAPISASADPKAIASIVDSVLAELRPRIVEEIAKKLADSRKD